jgi:hypothetical protein
VLADDDKKWIAAEISAQTAASEERLVARMLRIQTALLDELRKWDPLPLFDHVNAGRRFSRDEMNER